MKNLKEMFALILASEPTRSFRKIGIVDGDGLLTEDGTKVFLTWLLGKNSKEFKEEVVDKILEEQEKDCK